MDRAEKWPCSTVHAGWEPGLMGLPVCDHCGWVAEECVCGSRGCRACKGLGWDWFPANLGEDAVFLPCECVFAFWYPDRLLPEGTS